MSALAILTECPLAKCPVAKCPVAKCPVANCRLAKCPLANCLDTLMRGSRGGQGGLGPPPPSPQNIAPPNSEARAKRALAPPPGGQEGLGPPPPPYKILDPPMTLYNVGRPRLHIIWVRPVCAAVCVYCMHAYHACMYDSEDGQFRANSAHAN